MKTRIHATLMGRRFGSELHFDWVAAVRDGARSQTSSGRPASTYRAARRNASRIKRAK